MTMGHLLRFLIIIGLAIQLCDGTSYWSKPRQKKITVNLSTNSSTSTQIRTSSKFHALDQKSKIANLATRLQHIEAHSEEDSSEYNDDSCEDLSYRDSQSTRNLQSFVKSRTLSKKIKKKLKTEVKKTIKKKSIEFIAKKVAGKTAARSVVNNGIKKSFKRSSSTTTRTNTLGVPGNVFLSIPQGYVANTVSTTTTRLLTEQEAIRLGLLSDTSIAGITTKSYSTYQNGVNLNTVGNTVSRSVNSRRVQVENNRVTNKYHHRGNSQLNAAEAYDSLRNINTNSQHANRVASVNNNAYIAGTSRHHAQKTSSALNKLNSASQKYGLIKKLIDERNEASKRNLHYAAGRSLNENTVHTARRFDRDHVAKSAFVNDRLTRNQLNQNTGAAIDYRNVRASHRLANQYASKNVHVNNVNAANTIAQRNFINKNNRFNVANRNINNHVTNVKSQKIETRHTNNVGDKVNKSSGSKSSDSKSSSSESSEEDKDTSGGKSTTQALNKHRRTNSVHEQSTNVVDNNVHNVNNVLENTNVDKATEVSVDNENVNVNENNVNSDNVNTNAVDVTQKEIVGVNKVGSQENIITDDEKTNESDESSEEDGDEEETEEEDTDVSVYEYLNTYQRFRFDNGLNAVGIIGEVLSQLDYQRYHVMDDIIYPRDVTRYIVDGEEFDFIIVGGGNGGCVLASRLSQNPKFKVLLIELGGDPLPITQIPGLWDRALNSFTDWQYKIEPDQATGYGINGNMVIHKGKCLGGSSTTGAHLYVRGSEKAYDTLVKQGLNDWSYNSSEPYFKNIEKVRSVTKTEFNSTIYGTNGFIPISKFRKTEVSVLENVLSSGFEHIGCMKQPDINNKDIEVGFFSMQGIVKNGRSVNTAKAYLSSAFGRKNLKVMKYTRVTKVIIDTASMKTTGVEVQTKLGQTLTLRASKEVLLCAGAVGSAKLLMASGVGPVKHLTAMNVPVVKNLPVGEKFLITPVFTGFVVSYDKEIIYSQTDEEIAYKYLARNSGFLATPKGMGFGGFLNTGVSGSEYADVEVHQFYIPKNHPSKLCQLKSIYGFSDVLLTAYSKLNEKRAISIFTVALVNTKSTGRVLLKSKSPLDNPTIIGNMLSHEDDQKTLLEAVKLLSKITESPEMKLVDGTLASLDLDGCAKYEKNSDDYWKCLIKYSVSTTSNTAGSCRMGLVTDPEAVVDSELNVIGVSNLRVVGRSALPVITSAYSHIPCVMVAEKAYDIINSKYDL